MSVSCSFDLSIIDINTQKPLSCVRSIEMLVSYGWRIELEEGIYHLPLGDKGDYDWQLHSYTFESFLELVQKKEEQNEITGVLIAWEDTDIGASLLLWPYQKMIKEGVSSCISFLLTANRKLLIDENDLRVTDISWYTPKILKAFQQKDIVVDAYKYIELR